jgi:YVTN family beta-propeller protein
MGKAVGGWVRRSACALAVGGVVSCGGGGDDKPAPPPKADLSVLKAAKAQRVFVPSTPIPADANLKGMWSPVTNWPLIAVHAVLMPDGRVLSYGTNADGQQTAFFIYDVWDPEAGLDAGHTTSQNLTGTDIFCSSQIVLPDGNGVFIAGGDNWTGTATTNTGNNNSNLFSYTANTLARGENLNRPRWYSSSITLLNGETYIQGGIGGTDLPEVRGANGLFRLLSGASTSSLNYMYPRNFIAPDGRVFGYDSSGKMYFVDASAAGAIASMGQLPSAYTGSDASAAMFRPGRILQFGGNSNGAIVIDVRSGAPVLTPTQSMSSQRRLVTGTLLANGKVLATGGSSTWNELVNVNTSAEIWGPDTGTWTVGANGVQARLYHSNALLMPDGTVLVGGGGAPGPQNNTNVELYYPPYLFAAGGVLAPRPVITSAPTVLNIGKTFTMQVDGAKPIARVVLVKNGSTTHSFNMEQRFVELAFTAGGGQIAVQAPARAADAPPGFYMLFALDSDGVPAEAKMLRVNVADTPNPATVPVLPNPGDRTGTVSQPASLQLTATDPNGDALGFGASGLPPGLSLNAGTGLISGTPTAAGTYNVVVTVSDGVNVASANFAWTITGSEVPLVVTIPVPPSAAPSGSTATYTAAAGGSNTQFKWNFGDGSPETSYSNSPTITHAFAQPGLYYVTVTAIDDRGIESRQTVLQTVYGQPTAQKPTASSNLLFEPRATGNARLWVVNQDNDSVSVFDAVTRAKLAEIAVGGAPRTLALASNGMVWVANKRDASLSVIDANSLAMSRTIALPRGTQPFGIAMVPGAASALVVLEATGQLLKFSTLSYTQTGVASVGANPRHVSVSADGATAHVSRFITPPLAGEGTVVVDTGSGGGEIVDVGIAAMTVVRTMRLAHSDKPDAENQGRGVPNYLGAAVISPDGTQAWVPSKQDNIARGGKRDGLGLNFQNTVRAISSRIDLVANREDAASRIDHDNASMASAAAFDNNGLYLFIALETSREVAVVDAYGRRELFRFDVGRAPQGLVVSADNTQLFVSNFMDRSVSVFDLKPLLQQGLASMPALATLAAVSTEKLAANVLIGKQFFYDARDTRLARDRYMSCASCHNDGGHDGRVWDLSSLGEGLRNTISLRGRAGAQGFKHWSNNFDEVQDFEGQIRTLAGGTGLMSDAAFTTGTRSQPLGDRKTGASADLDALAAYVGSLATFDASPYRASAASLSSTATQGKTVFTALNCASCHSGAAFTGSGENTLVNIGTVKPSSGQRLYAALNGIDVPTLRDVWATAPYLHDGSAATLGAAVRAHNTVSNVSLSDADLALLTAYLAEIGGDEPAAAGPAGTGTGLGASYFNNTTLTGSAVLTRTEAVDFDWSTGRPGTGVNTDNFSARWVGSVVPPSTGTYRLQTVSDDGVRLWVNGTLLIDRWTDHSPATDTSTGINLTAGVKVDVKLEYYEKAGGATMRLRWLTPGDADYITVPAARLLPTVASMGGGLVANYFNNTALSGTAVLVRNEAVDFNWGSGSPGAGVNADNFSARWSGTVVATAAGSYRFQTESDDGVRLWVNGALLIDRWTDHGPTTDTSAAVSLTAGQRVTVRMEYYEKGGGAVARLRWLPPGASSYVAVPAANLYAN